MEARIRVALRRLAAAVAVALGVVTASPASAGTPSDALRAYIDRLRMAMEEPALNTPGRTAERHRTLRALAENALDFKESAQRALGSHWHARTPAERERFVRLFADLIDHAYLTRLATEGETVVLANETVDGAQAVVSGHAVPKNGGATPVDFYLHQGADGGWRIYDISFDGISLIGNYRAQFNKIIRTSSFEELANLLEAKTRASAQAPTDEPKTAP